MSEAREAAASSGAGASAQPDAAVPMEMVTTELHLPIPPEAIRPRDVEVHPEVAPVTPAALEAPAEAVAASEPAPPVAEPVAETAPEVVAETAPEEVAETRLAEAPAVEAAATDVPASIEQALSDVAEVPASRDAVITSEGEVPVESPWTSAPPSEEVMEADSLVEEISATPSRMDEAITKEAVRAELAPDERPPLGDDERTVISPMPAPPPSQDSALNVLAAATTFTAPPPPARLTPPEGTELVRPALGRLPSPPRNGLGTAVETVKRVAGHRVNASVAQLAIVMLASSVVGAAAVRLAGHRGEATALATPARVLDGPSELAAPRSPEIAPLPPEVEPRAAAAEDDEAPAKQKAALHGKLRLPRPATAAVAPPVEKTAENAAEPADAPRPAPAKKATKPATKPRSRHVAQQSNWVDPFGD